MESTVTTPKVETPMSVGQLENALRVAATEIFVKERRVSRSYFIRRTNGQQFLTMFLHSAAEPEKIVRARFTLSDSLVTPDVAVLNLHETIKQRDMGVEPGQESGAAIVEIKTFVLTPTTYEKALENLRDMPELKSVPDRRAS